MAPARHKKGRFTVKMQKKLLVVFGVVVASLIYLSYVIIRINITKGKDYSKAVYNNYSYDSRTIPAKRGDITDRNGTLLAYSTKVYNLILDSKVLLSNDKYREPTVNAILENFDIDAETLNKFIDDNAEKKKNGETPSSYKRMLQEISYEKMNEFMELINAKNSLIKGVWFEDEYKRIYPYKTFGCDVLGFASEANGGELGIEKSYNEFLSGTNGRFYGYINNEGYESTIKNATNGNTIVSTIDYTIQNIIENAIKNFNDQYGSRNTAVIAMDPYTGEILGCADYPVFDLNNPRDFSAVFQNKVIYGKDEPEEEPEEPETNEDGEPVKKPTRIDPDTLTEEEKLDCLFNMWNNYCVSSIYEPGSVFKPFIVAEALDEGKTSVFTTYECDGSQTYDGALIHCTRVHGPLTLAGGLVNSCNDALMQISMSIGKDVFAKYLKIYQFGKKTGVDLPGEEAGIVINYDTAMDVDLATNSFGQNISVTMVQVISSFCSLINGGTYYQPHVVKEIRSESGDLITKIEPQKVIQTISENTSKNVRAMMRVVVEYAGGSYVYVPGYSIAGKTGTAEKQPRDKEEYVVSFMGYVPAENPQIAVYVVIDAPQCEYYDSSWAAQQVSAEIMKGIIPYLGIERNNPEFEVPVYMQPERYDIAVHKKLYVPEPETEAPTEAPSEEQSEEESTENQ